MPKYINADDIIKLCDNKILGTNDDPIIQAHNNAFRCVKHQIKMIPESIVRCKDCKYYTEYFPEFYKPKKKVFYCCGGFVDGQMQLNPNDFCSYGERRESE